MGYLFLSLFSKHKENIMDSPLFLIFAVIIGLALLALLPWVAFWAIGVLFGYTIQLTWMTGIAYWVLVLMTCGGNKVQVSE